MRSLFALPHLVPSQLVHSITSPSSSCSASTRTRPAASSVALFPVSPFSASATIVRSLFAAGLKGADNVQPTTSPSGAASLTSSSVSSERSAHLVCPSERDAQWAHSTGQGGKHRSPAFSCTRLARWRSASASRASSTRPVNGSSSRCPTSQDGSGKSASCPADVFAALTAHRHPYVESRA